MQGSSGEVTCAMHMVDGLLYNKPNLLEVWGKGGVELFAELGQYAENCENLYLSMWNSELSDFAGVYDYEVSCEFGDWFGSYILRHEGEPPDVSTALEKLERLAKTFFDKGKKGTTE